MAKNVLIRKHKDKVEIRDSRGDLIIDFIVADSSRTNSVNLSIQADKTYAIDKVRQRTTPVDYCPNCGETHAIAYDCSRNFEMTPPKLKPKPEPEAAG